MVALPYILQEAFRSLLTPEAQQRELAKARRVQQNMDSIAASAAAAAKPCTTAGAAGQPPAGSDGELPSPARPLRETADEPAAGAAGVGRRARVGEEYDRMFVTDRTFHRVRLSGVDVVSHAICVLLSFQPTFKAPPLCVDVVSRAIYVLLSFQLTCRAPPSCKRQAFVRCSGPISWTT
jgi:hypothetical protein